MVDSPDKGNGRRISLIAGLLISAVCIGFIVQKVDFDEVAKAFRRFEWHYFTIGILSLAFGYSMRILRWSTILNATGALVSFRKCAAPFLGSIALNNVLPLRLGDVVRALVFPASIGVPRTVATSSLVMERLIDLMTLLMCLAVSLYVGQYLNVPQWLKDSAVLLASCGTVMLIAIFFLSGTIARFLAGMPGKFSQSIAALFKGFDAMSRLPVLLLVFGFSVLVWIGEAGLFYSLLLGFGLNATPAAATIIMAMATLATLVPSSPGYVGPFHLAAFAGISLLGGTNEQAASFAVLSHLGLWVPTTVAGAVAIAFTPNMFKGLRSLRSR